MSTRTREWLRCFLNLGARAKDEGISASDIERQEETILHALDMLDDRPGIVLADEVGMGKTYEALGIAAVTRHMNRRSRIVVITPGPDLNGKWFAEFSRFSEMYQFGETVCEVRQLSEFVASVRRHPVVVAPVTMFQSGRGSGAQTYLLSLYFCWKELHGHTANAIMARFRNGEHERVDVNAARFLDIFTLEQVWPHLGRAFRRGKSGEAAGLDDLYEKGGIAAFESEWAVRNALYRARFALTGSLMPMIDLLIVDEAHKLKNPGSIRTRAMQDVFAKRFRKALFLTATPFQLDIGEFREVFSLFARAKDAPKNLLDDIEALLVDVREYQQQYDDFQATWSSLDPELAVRFSKAYDHDPMDARRMCEPAITVVMRQIDALRELKTNSIEPGFRRWMIRSLREDKRTYRRSLPKKIRAVGVDALPFLIYERFIAELFRRQRKTHKAAAEINMVSSFAAAQKGEIMATADGIPVEAEEYRGLLRRILTMIGSGKSDHPKLHFVINDTLDAADRGEKTLVFCSRIATLEQLRRDLDRIWERRVVTQWQRVYPEADADQIFDTREDDDSRQRGRHSQLQARFHRPQDAISLALREFHCRSNASVAEWAIGRLPEIVRDANRLLKTVRVGKTAAERIDYQLAKRCVEQAALVSLTIYEGREHPYPQVLKNICDSNYLRFGLVLAKNRYEIDPAGDEEPHWEISERTARMVLGEGASLWESMSLLLNILDIPMRVRVVEQLARYLTYKQVPFLADLLAEGQLGGLSVDPAESAAFLEFMPRFWQTNAGQHWMSLLRTFLEYFVHRDQRQQEEILDGPIKTGDFARHTRDGESRERLREAFNTPLYPMVLIANEVMQEGLDLHKHCRRVVHHDLVWNPAQIEQRIGRIDRLGSLTSRLRETDPNATLDILYPIIQATIDERLYQTVKTREKWLEFLLGAPPNFFEYAFTDGNPVSLPERLARELSIDLRPCPITTNR